MLFGKLPIAVLAMGLSSFLTVLPPAAAAPAYAPGIADGPGIWTNLWNYPQGDLDGYFSDLKRRGIRNLFLQTSRSTTPALKDPKLLGEIIETSHKHGIRVIAWSFAELQEPEADARKMIAAAQFTSVNGQRLDGIAPNLEKNLEAWRVEKYSSIIREQLGNNYPMIAVVYSPLNKSLEAKRIPWSSLAKYYDVIAPMVYWNSKYEKIEPYDYTVKTVRQIRQLTGKPDLEIHAVGDGMGTSQDSINAFLKACQDIEVTSASLYPNQKVTEEQLLCLGQYSSFLESNARFRLAAYRQLVKNGHMSEPYRNDPSVAITTGEFYKLVVRHMHKAFSRPESPHKLHPAVIAKLPPASACKNVSPAEAHSILKSLGLIPVKAVEAGEDELSARLTPKDALSLLAGILEFDAHKQSGKLNTKNGRLDAWFVQPAAAETARIEAGGKSKPINYLDAAQMVVEAGAAVH